MNADRVALLEAHTWDERFLKCQCGFPSVDWAEHLDQVLTEAGF